MKKSMDNQASSSGEEARLRAILNTTVDGIVTINEAGLIQDFNKAARQIFGYTVDEVIGKNVSILLPKDLKESHDGYITNYVNTGQAKIIGKGREVKGVKKDGTIFPLALSVSEFWLDGQRMFTGILRDVTEQKKLERAIVSVGEKTRQLIGHELHDVLGQQLTGISLLSKALEKRLASVDQALGSEAANINEIAASSVSLVRRLAHGLYPTVLQRQGLQVALQDLAETQARLFRIDCSFKTGGGEISLSKDEELNVYRIAQEAVGNALKHSEAKHVAIRLKKSDDRILLRVSDDGVGIVEGVGQHGGMGLPIMKYRADMIGAEFSVQRGEDGGTLITCALPVKQGPDTQ